MDFHRTLSEHSYANALAQSADEKVFPIDAWVVTSDGFNGIVYTWEIARSKLDSEPNVTIGYVKLYRPVTRK